MAECENAPARKIKKALEAVVKASGHAYIEVDAGGAAWAASELVALSFGFGDPGELDDEVLEVVAKVRPKEDLRVLAGQAVARIVEASASELASLWHEGDAGPKFDAALADLRSRLEQAGSGARVLARPKAGDVFTLSAEPESRGLVVVQVIGSGEVAVFEGTCDEEASALAWLADRRAHRISTPLGRLLRRARSQGTTQVRKELRERRLYAFEAGAIERYAICSASRGSVRSAQYDEARQCAPLAHYDEQAVRSIALGTWTFATLRSPEQREAELRTREATRWTERRRCTTPSPFGDVARLVQLLGWMEEYGLENAIARFHDEATGRMGYGRPSEAAERGSYAFAGIVALWTGAWPAQKWPEELRDRLPPVPNQALLAQALGAARVLAARVITREAELRLIWSDTPEHDAELEGNIRSLQQALAAAALR